VLRVKQDTIRAMQSRRLVRGQSPATSSSPAAQLSGLGHYRMRGDVLIDTPEEFAMGGGERSAAAGQPRRRRAEEKK